MHYTAAYSLQKEIHVRIAKGTSSYTFILVEHYPVITIGKSGSETDVLKKNIPVIQIDRGGQVTFHGPGQLVGYILFPVKNIVKDLHAFMATLELSLIKTIADFGISAQHNKQFPGVWVADKKIASVGIAIHQGITMHGFALNIHTDLSFFRYIVPCGLKQGKVTSFATELVHSPSLQAVAHRYLYHMQDVFGFSSCIPTPLPSALCFATEQGQENEKE
ncbi:hypothetical protein LSH36_1091g00000 [Paralvinella palmiformis]|uniref:Octanoyl-[acyl-carrier-protein]:protein N-octanoyltransferase LIPT2, mitochondrial n=1 Tax=Paralvinella palmiformis TaxID=53620 RepID=A0AAD9IVS6_9ANNE|nr:hypothetical protein LSH36_1091g00000 [Paralvinella palmiformis]